MHYNPSQDNVELNRSNQGVNPRLSRKKQSETDYPGTDHLQNATIHDDKIYIVTHDTQHAAIADGERLSGKGASFSGYFTSQETAQNRINADGTFDAYGLARDTCMKPFSSTGNAGDAVDKTHLDCFIIDRDRLEQIYGTRDFNAAIGKCNANNEYGSDGGDQGYNAALTELYNNGCLKYRGTHDADPASVTKCRNEYDQMERFREKKAQSAMSGQSAEKTQKIGYPLDSRCHEKTNFNSTVYANKRDLDRQYTDYKPTYNKDIADTTTKEDRMTDQMWQNSSNASKQSSASQPSSQQAFDPSNYIPSHSSTGKSSGLNNGMGI